MVDSKKYNGSTWEHSLRKLTTVTDTFTTLPADVYADGTTATVGLKGNMVQTGTPTHDNPVMPNGTGERTGNLWNEEGFSARTITSTHEHSNTNPYGTTLSSTTGKEVSITQANYPTGTIGYQNGFFMIDVDFSKYAVGDVVTISFDYIVNVIHSLSTQKTTSVYAGKDSNAVPITLSSGDWKISGRLTAVITIIADMKPYVEVRLCGNSITVKNVMLNEGGTALPYEPYGIKIPISSASTTTPVYLGEVETTRKIKKLVLTGEETWYINEAVSTEDTAYLYTTGITSNTYVAGYGICSHFEYKDIYHIRDVNGFHLISGYGGLRFRIMRTIASTVSDFKAYLAQQYAAGTPVTVWYVLAEPTTGIVNEPLMKIGNYADTVSGITIPTITSKDTFDVDTTLKPSEVSLSYTGWHDASVNEWDGSQWNE